MTKKASATLLALLAAALYAIHIPISKQLLTAVDSTMLAGFLYLGAGVGSGLWMLLKRMATRNGSAAPLTKRDMPFTVAMVVLDILAPILLMLGIARTGASSASLLNNFEIVATSLVALLIFREAISRRLWLAIALVTAASALLTFDGPDGFVFNLGSLLVLGAALAWGFENNCTRCISDKSAEEIVLIKGLFSGCGSITVACICGAPFPPLGTVLAVMLLGYVSYGLSIRFYIMAQSRLGAAKTSAFYAVAPFLGVTFSFVLLRERPTPPFYIGLAIMLLSTVLMVRDTLSDEPSPSEL